MLSVIRDGIEYDISDGALAWFVGQDGWGMTPLHRLEERGPLQHGDTDLGFRLDPRIGRLIFQINGEDHNDLYDKRSQLMALFGPLEEPLAIRWNVNGQDRQIDAHYVGDMSYGSNSRRGFLQNVIVTLKAPDPTFYNPVQTTVELNPNYGTGSFPVPHAVPHNVGASFANVERAYIYQGTWDAYPIVTIYGAVTDPVIQNMATGEKLDFTGTTISSGNYYVIDLRYGYKTVIDQAGANKIANLTSDSDLATFHIERGPGQAGLGYGKENILSFTGTSVDTLTKVNIQFYIRYLGV